jgi:hypothetical protein
MDNSNAPSFLSEATGVSNTKRGIGWPAIVVALAAVSTIVWTFALFRTAAQILQFAVS